MHEFAQELYQANPEEAAAENAEAAPETAEDASAEQKGDDDNVVDAEYEEVKEK